jgi:hypothetical protein
MLSESQNQNQYKATDIFNLGPIQSNSGKRVHIDRNRSSVFGNDSAPSFVARKDRMASDIFFNQSDYSQTPVLSRRVSDLSFLSHASAPEEHKNYQADYSAQNSLSNVFDSASPSSVRAGRRQFIGRQQSTDIFFNGDAPPVSRKPSPPSASYQAPKWVPSIKMSSHSNTSLSSIFGDCPEIDRQVAAERPHRSYARPMEHTEKLTHTFGVSSETLHREKKGRGGLRHHSDSQILF